jgi:hypothetical protein
VGNTGLGGTVPTIGAAGATTGGEGSTGRGATGWVLGAGVTSAGGGGDCGGVRLHQNQRPRASKAGTASQSQRPERALRRPRGKWYFGLERSDTGKLSQNQDGFPSPNAPGLSH